MEIKEKLMERARKYHIKLKEEEKNIAKLKEIIEQYLKGKETSIKTVILNEFARDLGVIIEKYNNNWKGIT